MQEIFKLDRYKKLICLLFGNLSLGVCAVLGPKSYLKAAEELYEKEIIPLVDVNS